MPPAAVISDVKMQCKRIYYSLGHVHIHWLVVNVGETPPANPNYRGMLERLIGVWEIEDCCPHSPKDCASVGKAVVNEPQVQWFDSWFLLANVLKGPTLGPITCKKNKIQLRHEDKKTVKVIEKHKSDYGHKKMNIPLSAVKSIITIWKEHGTGVNLPVAAIYRLKKWQCKNWGRPLSHLWRLCDKL